MFAGRNLLLSKFFFWFAWTNVACKWSKYICSYQKRLCAVLSFMAQGTTLPGDTLLITAFISYVGCFTKQFRLDLMNKLWLTYLRSLEPPIPITEGLDTLTLLTDDTTVAMWQNEGLPSDRMSIENATILSNSVRWPLMIDPQLQGMIYCHIMRSVYIVRQTEENWFPWATFVYSSFIFDCTGVKWIKQKYGDELRIIRIGQKNYLETIEMAIVQGLF